MPNVTMLTKQLSDRRRGHISNRVRRNALISLSLTPRLGWSRSTSGTDPLVPSGRAIWHGDERGEYDNGGFRFMSW
jgi:hypothetical protein